MACTCVVTACYRSTALEYVDRVYLITEVVYSAGVDLVVSAAGRTKQYFSRRILPLAFAYQKFPLDELGAVGTEVGTGPPRPVTRPRTADWV